MLRDVQTLNFMVLRNPQADHHVYNLEDRQGAADGQRPGHRYTDQLVDELMRVAFEPAGRKRHSVRALKDGVDYAGRKHSGQQRADGSARAVYAKGVERVVIAEARL